MEAIPGQQFFATPGVRSHPTLGDSLTLFDLRESWEWATKEERKDLARMMIQEVGVDVAAKRVIWIKARPDFDVLFQLLNNLRVDEHRRFWIAYPEAKEDACDIREELGQEGMEVKIAFPVSHNT